MKRTIGIISTLLVVLILAVVSVTPAFAQTPDANASCIAQCAVQMGGQHVAACAHTMNRRVSICAQQMTCPHNP